MSNNVSFVSPPAKHDGDMTSATIQKNHVLVEVDEKKLLEFKGGIVAPETWADKNADLTARWGTVFLSRADGVVAGDIVFFSYLDGRGANKILNNGRLLYVIPKYWLYLKLVDGKPYMLNGYLLGESIEEQQSSLLIEKKNDWKVRIIHAGELDENGANPSIREGDVILYRMSLPNPLQGLKRLIDGEYRVISRANCMAKFLDHE